MSQQNHALGLLSSEILLQILSRLLSFLITFGNGWSWKLQNHHQSFDVTLCMRQWLSSSSKVGKIVEPWSKFSNLKIFMWNSKVIMHIFWPKSLIEILPEKKGLNFIAELNRNFLFCPNWIWYKTMANYSFPTIKMSLETEKKMTWPWTPIGSGSSLVSN